MVFLYLPILYFEVYFYRWPDTLKLIGTQVILIIILFITELESFLQQASTRINDFMNSTLIFKALPQALQVWNDQVECIYRDLCVSANSLCHTISKSGGEPENNVTIYQC